MSRFLRPLLLVWLVWHLFVMSVDLSKHVSRSIGPGFGPLYVALDAWSGLRDWTEWYQWRVGVHQNWSMFVPNPRLSTSWLVVEGVRPDGTRVPLELVVGRPDEDSWIGHYERAGKHERNALARHRDRLRMAYTRHFCRLAREAGEPLKSVQFFQEVQPTPPPARRGLQARADWKLTRRELGGWNCPR